jgi:L-arabinose isomerase
MPDDSSQPRVGLLALTLEFYERHAPELRADRQRWVRQSLLPALEPIAEVLFDGTVCRREEVDAAVAGMESAGVDALLVVCVSYSPSQISLPALLRTRLPIMIWNTQELFAVDETFDTAQMIANHGVHGTQDLSSVLLRCGVRFRYVTSHLSDSQATRQLSDFFAAAAAVARLRRLRIGLLGYPFPGMGDFAMDTTRLAATLGCQWVALSMEDYIQGAESAAVDSVRELRAEYRRLYLAADDLTDDDLEATARAELSLRAMVAEHRLDALSYQFLSFGEDERTETLPFVAASRLMAEGIGFGGEGDLIGAAGTWLLNRLKPPASFSEIFTVDFAQGGLFMSHMGEANVAMARRDRPLALVARSKPITRTRAKQLALVTNFQPGEATLVALTRGPDQRWRFVASRVQIADFGPLPDMAVPHFKILPRQRDVRDWLTAYASSGGPHHNAICFGDATGRVRIVADLLDADYIEV